MKLTFPMPMNASNGSHGSWGARYSQKQRYWKECDVRQGAGLIPPPPAKPLSKASISSVMYLGGAMDDDNAMRRHKWVLDWLKTRGYIVDDRRKNLTWQSFPEQHVARREGNYRIELTLTPLSASPTP